MGMIAYFVCLVLASSNGMQTPEEVSPCTGRVADISRIALDAWLESPEARGSFTKNEVSLKVREFAAAYLSTEYTLESLQSIEISSKLISCASSELRHILSTERVEGKCRSFLFDFSDKKSNMAYLKSPEISSLLKANHKVIADSRKLERKKMKLASVASSVKCSSSTSAPTFVHAGPLKYGERVYEHYPAFLHQLASAIPLQLGW